MTNFEFTIQPVRSENRSWVREWIVRQWGAETVVVHDQIYYPAELPGFVAVKDDKPVGLITYSIEGRDCEVVTLDSLCTCKGVGTRLIAAVEELARQVDCRRLWLITTNDNLNALGFYQKRGFRLLEIYPGAVDRARKRKPQIPLLGENKIPIHDEIELEKRLEKGSASQ